MQGRRQVLIAALIALTTGCASRAPQDPNATEPPSTQGRVGPGMDANGNVVDSRLVSAGYGQKVKGLGGWQGEITGRPAPNSPFTKLEIGMPLRQVIDLIGPPTDQGRYVTGKNFIPYYFGSDRFRHEFAYKGQGRLIFASGSPYSFNFGGNLIWIIHNANDSGYR